LATVVLLAACGASEQGGGDADEGVVDDDFTPIDDDANGDDDDNDDDNNNDNDDNNDSSPGDDDESPSGIEFFGTWYWNGPWDAYGCVAGHGHVGTPPETQRWNSCDFWGIWGSGPSDVYAVGATNFYPGPFYVPLMVHWNGQTWATASGFPILSDLEAVYGTSPDNVYAVGNISFPLGGNPWVIYRYDGQSWQVAKRAWANGSPQLGAIWAAPTGEVFAVGAHYYPTFGYLIVQNDGGDWLETREAGADERYLSGVWGASPDDVFAVGGFFSGGESVALHYDGAKWTDMDLDAGFNVGLTAVAGSSGSDVYAIGDDPTGIVLHYDGAAWENMGVHFDVSYGPTGLWVAGPSSVFVARGGQGILHYDGETWTDYSDVPVDKLWGFVYSKGE
jgi:hypothetical protein